MDILFSPIVAFVFIILNSAFTITLIFLRKTSLFSDILRGILFIQSFIYYVVIFVAIGIMMLKLGWNNGVYTMDASAITPVRVEDWHLLLERSDQTIVSAIPESTSLKQIIFNPETIITSEVKISTYSNFWKNNLRDLHATSSIKDASLIIITLAGAVMFYIVEISISTILYSFILPFEVVSIGFLNLGWGNGIGIFFLDTMYFILIVGNLFLSSLVIPFFNLLASFSRYKRRNSRRKKDGVKDALYSVFLLIPLIFFLRALKLGVDKSDFIQFIWHRFIAPSLDVWYVEMVLFWERLVRLEPLAVAIACFFFPFVIMSGNLSLFSSKNHKKSYPSYEGGDNERGWREECDFPDQHASRDEFGESHFDGSMDG